MSIQPKPRDAAFWRRARCMWLFAACFCVVMALSTALHAYAEWDVADAMERRWITSRPPEDVAPLFRALVYRQRRDAYINYAVAVGWLVPAGLCLRAARRASARRLTALQAEGICIHCGYDLRGLTENRCPECGRPFGPPPSEDQA